MSGPRTPLVTGISPKEGPPGTRVTIRGENLGVDPRDLLGLRICGIDCLLSAEWKSSKQIIARTGQAKTKGDIIVTTRTGGVGSSTVKFRGYNITVGPLQESAVWINETATVSTSRHKVSSVIAAQAMDDPLGISDESNDPRKIQESQLVESFPEGSGNTALDNFVPEWYLLENHHGTSFDDLKAGLVYLKRKSGQRSEGPREFLKTNLTTFLDCYDSLTEMHGKMKEDQSSVIGGSVTQCLADILVDSNKTADELFHDVLRRKDKADSTRNALGVLQRFKFLFNLPCTMDRNIKKLEARFAVDERTNGDYDLVITDYTRAKKLFGDTDVQVFKKVYQEVENRIASFREMLKKKLMALPSSLDEQKKLIRYLVHLETPGDPAWECLLNMQKWMINLLKNCKEAHINKDAERDRDSNIPLSPSRLGGTKSNKPTTTKTPHKIQFVDSCTKILMDNLPDLWKLGQLYLSGKLLKGVKKNNRAEASKTNSFKQKVGEVIDLASKLLRAAFLPQTLERLQLKNRDEYGHWKHNPKDSPTGWLPLCVRYIRGCTLSLANNDLPPYAMDILVSLTFDLRANCMGTLLKQAIQDIENLKERETWAVDSDDARGGTTLLPALFENIVNETLQHLQEVVHAKPGEGPLFEDPLIQKESVELCVKLLQAFGSTAEQLADIENKDTQPKAKRNSMSPDFAQGEVRPSLDKRLIIMMSNCIHTKEHILPRLIELLDRHGYPDTAKVQAAASWCYQNLDEKFFDFYIEEKANPIIGVLEQNMYAGKFDWNACVRPKGVRNYIKESLLGILEVHAEVYSICPNFVSKVMYRLVEYVVDEISRLFQCVAEFSTNGAILATLEIYALDSALGAFKTDETYAALKEALNCVPQVNNTEDKRLIQELLGKFKNQFKLQLMCFQKETAS